MTEYRLMSEEQLEGVAGRRMDGLAARLWVRCFSRGYYVASIARDHEPYCGRTFYVARDPITLTESHRSMLDVSLRLTRGWPQVKFVVHVWNQSGNKPAFERMITAHPATLEQFFDDLDFDCFAGTVDKVLDANLAPPSPKHWMPGRKAAVP